MRPFPVTPRRAVPPGIILPSYVGRRAPEPYRGEDVQSPEVIERMREAGRLAHLALEEVQPMIAPGVTTDAIDAVIHDFICDHGGYPSPLGYRGYPKSCCTSVNEVICHGIPDLRPLEDGDLLKVDVTVFKDGVHGDNCMTFGVGELDQASTDLMNRTREALERAIKAVQPGRQLNVIGRVIESYASRFGYGVVRDYTGHGVHTAFHSGLIILHYDQPGVDTVIAEGMTFTIEPMITLGDYRSHVLKDGWTVVTNDGSRCAQWEQTIVVGPDGAEVLTAP